MIGHGRYALRFVSLLALLSLPQAAPLAASLKGEFTMSGKAPEVGLIYFTEDKSASLKDPNTINQKNKEFTEKLVVGSKGSRVIFKNSDIINHNIFADDGEANVKFDVGLLPPGSLADQNIGWEDKVIKCSCKIHPHMRAWIASVTSRYYKIVTFQPDEKTVKFEMEGFPENLSKVKVWLPNYPTKEINIKKGESKRVEIEKADKSLGTLQLTRE